ncbi:IMPACT family protein [Crenothrix sp.]|uniref:IMPACT family protein n=1 Tax=Crenothrix sp. TaxID=3100433 RepID=UPI00374D759F
MYCIKTKHSLENNIKKSRFIGVVIPCIDVQEVQNSLKQLALEYADASHIAFAYRLKTENGLIYRFYDAGEPTGTAGKPIFQHIEGKNLINLTIAVIRYFGGIKLGAGGLMRAYGNTARDVIEAAQISPYIELASIQLTLDYQQLQPLEFLLKKLDGVILKQEFGGQIQLVIQLPAENTHPLFQSFPNCIAML